MAADDYTISRVLPVKHSVIGPNHSWYRLHVKSGNPIWGSEHPPQRISTPGHSFVKNSPPTIPPKLRTFSFGRVPSEHACRYFPREKKFPVLANSQAHCLTFPWIFPLQRILPPQLFPHNTIPPDANRASQPMGWLLFLLKIFIFHRCLVSE